MRTPYRSFQQFREKSALLATALALDGKQAMEVLAHISGYEHSSEIAQGPADMDLLSSREELMARLQAICPDIPNEQAASVIDRLSLPVRETDMGQFSRSSSAAPNISG